ncbi:glycosyltransferase family 4 protein [Francisellaceae bacterium]|nr:glycosyltransferase family 4 protein [Francisellaceae bacterium]
MKKIKVAHLTSAHPRYDVRVFVKECKSLAENGFLVSLVVADGKGNECLDNVEIYDVGVSKGKLDRVLNITRRVFKQALDINADIYHLHDPELLLVANKLRKLGKIVIFDAHEDLPKQILSKPYLRPWQRKIFSLLAKRLEIYVCSRINAVVTATPTIQKKFSKFQSLAVDINNYPILNELLIESCDWNAKANQVCYAGGLTQIRGIEEMIIAVKSIPGVSIKLAGGFQSKDFEDQAKNIANANVSFLGFIDRMALKNLYGESRAGMVVLYPTPNHLESLPIKMFEYLSAGIPVICSNFPLWQEIISKHQCGLCVDPQNVEEITEAIRYLLSNSEIAIEMGENGKKAVQSYYNWENECAKLINLYEHLRDKNE